jgi:uncharacterized protein
MTPAAASIDPIGIIARYYPPGSRSHRIVLEHGRLVAAKALAAAAAVPEAAPDAAFIESAALLHDIGIFLTRAPELGCHGAEPYIRHGVLGRGILEALGHPRHGLVCERHVGGGLSAREILSRRLPLPARDMLPVTLEEEIICYADKFFSKNGRGPAREKTPAEIAAEIAPYGAEALARFMAWHARFGKGAAG